MWWLLLLQIGSATPTDASAAPPDPRSRIVLHESCASELQERDLTLFANGTVRLLEGPLEGQRLLLHEIGHDDLAALRKQLGTIDLSELGETLDAPEGEWVMSCRLEVDSGSGELVTVRYGGYDTGGLGLGELRRIVSHLVELARKSLGSELFPAGWRPTAGDLLERNDGVLFEIVGHTADGKAVELVGVDQPVTVFVGRDEVRSHFRRLVERNGGE